MSTRCAHRFANQYKPLLVNCCIFMIPATVKSKDIPPQFIRPVLLCYVPDNSIKMALFPADNAPVVAAGCDYSSPPRRPLLIPPLPHDITQPPSICRRLAVFDTPRSEWKASEGQHRRHPAAAAHC